jgi:hypothetical protein
MLTVMAIRGVGNRWLVSGFLLLLGILESFDEGFRAGY